MKVEQKRYGKELFPGGKHSGRGGGGGRNKKPKGRISRSDRQFARARDARNSDQEQNSELASEEVNKNPRFLQDAYLAGGSRPMTQGDTVQPGNTNAPNMGNFGGAMNISGVPSAPIDPTTGMPMNYGMMQDEKSANEKAAQIDAIPGMPENVKASMKANIDQQRMMRTVKSIKPSETYGSYKDFRGDLQKSTIDDSTFKADSLDFTKGINTKYKLDMDNSYNYNLKNNPKAVEFVERMNPQDRYKIGQDKKERKSMRVKRGK